MTQSHTSCGHKNYALTCDEFEGLLRMAAAQCMLCSLRKPLCIDHDHAVGAWAVRGLVCSSCNQRLRYVDNGKLPPWPAAAAYLQGAWHLTQISTAGKAARARPRVDCPLCGCDVAKYKDGAISVHYNRRRGLPYGTLCDGTATWRG